MRRVVRGLFVLFAFLFVSFGVASMLYVHAESSITASLEGQENNTLGSNSSYTMTISQDLSYITNGTYQFSIDVMGDTLSSNVYVYAKVNGVEVKILAPLTAWGTWKTYSVTFTASLTDTVEVGFYISASGIWGYMDNAVLTRTDSQSSGSTTSFTNDLEDSTFDSLDGWTINENTTLGWPSPLLHRTQWTTTERAPHNPVTVSHRCN